MKATIRAGALAGALSLGPTRAGAQAGEPIREIETDKTVQEAADALAEVLESGGMRVHERIDLAEGLDGIGPMQLVVFDDVESAQAILTERGGSGPRRGDSQAAPRCCGHHAPGSRTAR